MALRVGLLSLLALLVLTALGSGAWAARNLFDADYQDCPAGVRVASLTGVQAVRTDKDDELQVEWNAAPWTSWNLHGSTAEITVLVASKDRTKSLQKANKALGATRTTFKDVDLATDWVIQVAVTDRAKVISDIVEVEFTSGISKPRFSSGLYWAKDHTTKVPSGVTAGSSGDTSVNQAANRVGDFYYIGYNKYFDNWYVKDVERKNPRDNNNDELMPYPINPPFRLGLRHGTDKAADAQFNHFRIRVEDESGDNILGYDAKTVVDSAAYRQGEQEFGLHVNKAPTLPLKVSNIALSNRMDAAGQRLPALHEKPGTALGPRADDIYRIYGMFERVNVSDMGMEFNLQRHMDALSRRSPLNTQPSTANLHQIKYWCMGQMQWVSGSSFISYIRSANFDLTADQLSFAEFTTFVPSTSPSDPRLTALYAELPDQIYDLPEAFFSREGAYKLTAWAEDKDNNRISPQTSLTFSIQEFFQGRATLTAGEAVHLTNYLSRVTSSGAWWIPDMTPFEYNIYLKHPVRMRAPLDAVYEPTGWRCILGNELVDVKNYRRVGNYPYYSLNEGQALVVSLTIDEVK